MHDFARLPLRVVPYAGFFFGRLGKIVRLGIRAVLEALAGANAEEADSQPVRLLRLPQVREDLGEVVGIERRPNVRRAILAEHQLRRIAGAEALGTSTVEDRLERLNRVVGGRRLAALVDHVEIPFLERVAIHEVQRPSFIGT